MGLLSYRLSAMGVSGRKPEKKYSAVLPWRSAHLFSVGIMVAYSGVVIYHRGCWLLSVNWPVGCNYQAGKKQATLIE